MRERSANQRDFYRVDCDAMVSCCTLAGRIPAGRGAESYFGESGHLRLLRDLHRLDQENAQLLHVIAESDRNLGNYLHLLNRKLDLLARHVASLSPELQGGSEQSVSISEGGLGFTASEPPPVDAIIALRITLLPAFVTLAVFGRVVSLQPLENGNSHVSARFEDLQETERTLIARHVMQVQMADQRRKMARE